jgi:hypothetical protein
MESRTSPGSTSGTATTTTRLSRPLRSHASVCARGRVLARRVGAAAHGPDERPRWVGFAMFGRAGPSWHPGGAGTGRALGDYGIRRMLQVPRRMLHVVCQAARWVPSCRARARGMSPRAGHDVQHRATRATSHNVAQQRDVATCHDARSIARRRETSVLRHCAATRYCAPLPEVAVDAPCSTALQRGAPCRSRACFVPAACAMLQRPLVQAGAQIEYMTAGHVRAGYHEVIRTSLVRSMLPHTIPFVPERQ